MKVSELWLREWVNPALDEQQLASLLTMAGLEVDAVIRLPVYLMSYCRRGDKHFTPSPSQ